MAKYELNGQIYEFEDGITDDEALMIMEEDQAVSQPESQVPEAALDAPGGVSVLNQLAVQPEAPPEEAAAPAPLPELKEYYAEEDLYQDPQWITDAKTLYREQYGEEFAGDDRAAANWLLNEMSWFNNNIVSTGMDLRELSMASDEYKQAFGRAIDMYDRSETTWNTFGRAILPNLTDPIGLGGAALTIFTGGASGAAAQGARVFSKEVVKTAIKKGLQSAAIMGTVEGAASNGALDFLKQRAEQEIDPSKEFDTNRWLTSTGIGAAAGFGLGVAAPMIARGANAAADATGQTFRRFVGMEEKPAAAAVTPQIGQTAPQPGQTGQTAIPVELNAPQIDPNDPRIDSNLPPATTLAPSQDPSARPPQALPEGVATPQQSGVPEITIRPPDAPTGEGKIITRQEIRDALDASRDPEKLTKWQKTLSETPAVKKTMQDLQEQIAKIAPDGTFGNLPTSRAEIEGMVRQVSDVLSRVQNPSDGNTINFEVAVRAMTQDQQHLLKVGLQQAAERFTQVRADLMKQVAKGDTGAQEMLDTIAETQVRLANLDKFISSMSGKDLASRVGGILTNERRGLSPESILESRGIAPELATKAQREAAEKEFVDSIDEFYRAAESDAQVKNITREMNDAWTKGDTVRALQKYDELNAAKLLHVSQKSGVEVSTINRFWNRISGMAIANVFSLKTLVVNLGPAGAKLLTKPMITYMGKGVLDPVAFREMMASYTAMRAATGSAFNAGKAAFRYERGLLGEDVAKLYDTDEVWGGAVGRTMRFFPRMLAASDTAMSHVIYRGKVAGDAAAQATAKAIENGLKGKNLEKFVEAQIKKALDNAFEKVVDPNDAIPMLRVRGIQRGYKGDALNEWIRAELQRNGEYLKAATSEQAVSFTDEMLFRSAFTGTGMVDKTFGGVEWMIQRQPWLRFFVQLFLRTPVRVFQEGLRMTPGLNLLNPKFMADLMGRNGEAAWVRAYGESMVGLGAAGATLLALSTGSMTGAGPKDPKQRRNLERTGWKPYSVYDPASGKYISYRNLDPLATPMKIIANVFEKSVELRYRASQGERINEKEWETAMQYVSIAGYAITQAIRDAGLTEGISSMMDLVTSIGDAEEFPKQLAKYSAEKLNTLIPFGATSFNIQQALNPTVNDARTFEQFITGRINPSNSAVPRQYDLLGGEAVSNIGTGYMLGVDLSSPRQPKDAAEKKRLDVLTALSSLEIAANTSFALPYKNEKYGTNDLRMAKSSDGTTSLYDKWQQKIAEYDQWTTDILHKVLIEDQQSPMPTDTVDTPKVERARMVLQAVREAAWAELVKEEAQLNTSYRDKLIKQQTDLLGINDNREVPFINR